MVFILLPILYLTNASQFFFYTSWVASVKCYLLKYPPPPLISMFVYDFLLRFPCNKISPSFLFVLHFFNAGHFPCKKLTKLILSMLLYLCFPNFVQRQLDKFNYGSVHFVDLSLHDKWIKRTLQRRASDFIFTSYHLHNYLLHLSRYTT